MKRKLSVGLMLVGPLLTRATGVARLGVDTMTARRAKPGVSGETLYFPDTLVRGKLREAMTELADWCHGQPSPAVSYHLVGELFGAGTGTANDDLRGCLDVSDFFLDEPLEEGEKLRYRIAIDSNRKSVKRGSLEVMDSPIPTGTKVTFSGTIEFHGANDEVLDERQTAIHMGLCWLSQLGANRTSGFGKVADVTVAVSTPLQPVVRAEGPQPADLLAGSDGRLGFVLSFPEGEPFCVTKWLAKNYFESDTVLSGAVVRGSLAMAFNRLLGRRPGEVIDDQVTNAYPALAKYFDTIRFSHLFPSELDSDRFIRPVVPPLSLVKLGDNGFFDAATECAARCVDGKLPAFDIDWKTRTDVLEHFGWPVEIEQELRVHNEHDPNRRRAMDEHLFAYMMVVPHDRKWTGWVDVVDVPDAYRETVTQELMDLLAKTDVLVGKTQAHAKGALVSQGTVLPKVDQWGETSAATDGTGLWVVTLQSHALVCNPSALVTGTTIVDACKSVFTEFSGDSAVEVKQVFARQSLRGDYLANRYLGNSVPFLLFEPGSTFVLTSANPDLGTRAIKSWLRKGLPFPKWADTEYAGNDKGGSHWSRCPFIPQNGYGEVVSNLDEQSVNWFPDNQ